MAREYVDLYLQRLDEEGVAVLAGYGYRQACVENLPNGFVEIARRLGLTVRRKKVLNPSSRAELLECLRETSDGVCVSVRPMSREALMTAVRDTRVDTVLIHGGVAEIDRHIIEVWENGIEIAVSELLACVENVKMLRTVMAYCRKAVENNIPLTVSSGAASTDEILPPQQLAYVLAALTDFETPIVQAVSTTPIKILEKVRK